MPQLPRKLLCKRSFYLRLGCVFVLLIQKMLFLNICHFFRCLNISFHLWSYTVSLFFSSFRCWRPFIYTIYELHCHVAIKLFRTCHHYYFPSKRTFKPILVNLFISQVKNYAWRGLKMLWNFKNTHWVSLIWSSRGQKKFTRIREKLKWHISKRGIPSM